MVLVGRPVAAMEVNTGAPPADSTALIQALLNAGNPVVLPANTVTNVTGLTCPAGGASIRGENATAVLHVTTNAAAIYCNGANLSVSNLTITGTGPNYTGYGTGPTDLGQRGIHAVGAPELRLQNVRFSNFSGSGFEMEDPTGSFGTPRVSTFSDIVATHSFRGIYTHNYAEYANFSNVQVKSNVFGMEIASANVMFSNTTALYNSVGIKISGIGNTCHGTFNGGQSNHNTYNLIVQSCGAGQTFNGMHFIADQSGGIASGSQGIFIYNSRGVTIANGQIGVNVSVVAADPNTSSAALSGANLLSNNYVRDDITNFAQPFVSPLVVTPPDTPAKLLMKGNYNASGLVGWNN